jgi:hypothetical protein
MRVARLQCVLPGMPTSLCCPLLRVSYHGRWAGRTGSAGLPSAARARDGTPRYEKVHVQQHRGDYQQGGSSALPVLPPAIIRGVQYHVRSGTATPCDFLPIGSRDSPSLQRARPPSSAPRRAGNGTVSCAGWRASLTRPLRQLVGIVGAAPDGPWRDSWRSARAPGLSDAQRRWSARPVREPGRGTVRSDVIVECVETDVWPPGMPRCALIGIRYSQDSDTECAMPIVESSARPWVCSLSVFSAANIAGREAAVRLHWVACAAGLLRPPALPAASSVRPKSREHAEGAKPEKRATKS